MAKIPDPRCWRRRWPERVVPMRSKKTSKEAAQYQDSPNGDQQCSGCRFFVEGGSCQLVEGEISPNGWRRLYQPMG